jgi:hypothetical protein
MKADPAAPIILELLSPERALTRQDPPPPDCVEWPGTLSPFHPRRMPALRLACPSSEGTAQRYRQPLWRTYEPPSRS